MTDIEYIREKLSEETDDLIKAIKPTVREWEVGINCSDETKETFWRILSEKFADIIILCAVLDINCVSADVIEILRFKHRRWGNRLKEDGDLQGGEE